ncbi:MAG: hypothetical protein ACJAVK_001355, partial [Akkermansiaceae bacterium]
AEIPTDGLPHIYQFILENVNTEFRGLRLDASVLSNVALEFDYVRLGIENFTPSVDPAKNINLFTPLAEFNINGEFEGWTGNNISPISVGGGILTGLTSSGDSQLQNNTLTFEPSIENADLIEVRLRRDPGDRSRIDLFWADDRAGFAGDRRISLPDGLFPNDGQFHVVQFAIGHLLAGNLSALRLDPSADLPTAVGIEVDSIRYGLIAPDGDNDGLADIVESGTGVFANAYDTGTDPTSNDTDNDTYLDGDEVAAGTDPNDAGEFPAPAITGYSMARASYLINDPITDNLALVAFGTPLTFSVNPDLPTGLTLAPSTGTISGTPSVVTAESNYAVTADFGEGITANFDLTLSTVNPGIIRYGSSDSIYRIGVEIDANGPVLLGGAPTSYSISPALPGGLFFNTSTGEIIGIPDEITPATDYTVTAGYPAAPDSTFILSIRTRTNPVFLGRDNAPLSSFVSLGEWNVDGEFDGWAFIHSNGTSAEGILTFNATEADPIMNRNGFIDLSLGTILEIRLKQSDLDGVQFFWADDTGGPAPVRQTTILGDQIANDGLFHTYQISFADVIVGDLDTLRVDPGNVGGRTVEIDYIRIGSAAPPITPAVIAFAYDPTFGDIEITWQSVQGSSYLIESATSLDQATWTTVIDNLSGDEATTTYLGSPVTTDRFFRVVREN